MRSFWKINVVSTEGTEECVKVRKVTVIRILWSLVIHCKVFGF